ncbi:unnamed protein product, partial [Anisakis simplex]|uniref:acid phosphatase n=1 Tax=Anisakis simplex TaxID=6269 RepID=A0A0M3IYK2_ANISI
KWYESKEVTSVREKNFQIWRHGDRTPAKTFKSDPYQEDAWSLGWGQLTPIGMEQMMELGDLLYKEYVVKNKFLNTSYKFNEMYVRTTDVNRTYISAYSNLIGMYYNRTQSIPNVNFPNNTRWPGLFVPFPVHATVDYAHDYVGNPRAYCPRREWLWSKTKETPEFRKLEKENDQFMKELTTVTGDNITLDRFWYLRDTLYIERLYNKTQRIIDETAYQRIDEIMDLLVDYGNGLDLTPVDNINFRVEVPKVRGGSILWAIIDNFDLKLFCYEQANQDKPQCNWMKHLRYYAYSAHDTTLLALMSTLGVKHTLLQHGHPDYSACLSFELWQTDNGPALRVSYEFI